MGESLKKHKKIAADLRAASQKKAREIAQKPVEKECNKAVIAATRSVQRRLNEVFNEYPDNSSDGP